MTTFEKATARQADKLTTRNEEIAGRRAVLEGSDTLTQAMLAYEGKIIREAMRVENGSITRTAKLLGMSYQALSYILDTRHEGLRHKPKVPRVSGRDSHGMGQSVATL